MRTVLIVLGAAAMLLWINPAQAQPAADEAQAAAGQSGDIEELVRDTWKTRMRARG
ncbi:MAG: hypothetical protein U5K76_15155 [Woeseiaceae bacterium]|nr:hypothetical protein [Woeseiaceae bacterium]